MSKPPKEFARVTNNKNPKHQIYQPGFNPSNGCWLEGSWVTLPEAEWLAKKDAHVAAYHGVYKVAGHYRDPAIPIEQLTPWQRQAYEHYSGQITVSALDKHGNHGGITIDMAGAGPNAKSLAWIRECGYRILPRVRNGHTGEVTSQLEGCTFPADVVAPDVDPVPDPWEHIIRKNVSDEQEMYLGFFGVPEEAGAGEIDFASGMWGSLSSFSVSMGVQGIIDTEDSIIRTEWNQARGQKDPYAHPEGDRAFYVKLRARGREVLKEQFDAVYAAQKASHNSCARTNLDNSNGKLFSFVLPEFREDGSHEPWGEHDVPWDPL